MPDAVPGLPLTFDEAHALYSPPPGTGMTRPQAHAFLRRYSWHLRQEGGRVAVYIKSETGRQPVSLHYPDDEEQVRLYDVNALTRHANRIPNHGCTVVGYVHYRARGGEFHHVALCVEWATERVFSAWHGPIRPPKWGDDQTQRERWVERPLTDE